jgi:DNA-binding beta-propeller fold protein YncE
MKDTAHLARFGSRMAGTAAAIAMLASAAIAQEAPAQPDNGWTFAGVSLATGVNTGYQLAFDPVGRQVYLTDANWRAEEKRPDGSIVVTRYATGKVVVFDVDSRSWVANHSFLGLSRSNGSGDDTAPLDWSTVAADVTTANSNRVSFSPNGIAVDGTTTNAAGQPDATIITTSARGRDPVLGYGGHVVIYNASQGGPTDADRIWQFEDGTPIFDGIRRVALNTTTHTAYISNFADARGAGARPGFVAVVDLLTREVEARVRVPETWGAIGVAVDEENNLIYVGTLTGQGLYVIDGDAIDTSNAQDLSLNDAAITQLPAVVGENARPTYSPELKRLYVSTYASPAGKISVIDADPASATYGTVLEVIETGATNSVAVDGERGLIYSANLGDQEVVVYDANTHEELLRMPTTGNALNIGIDPETHDVWVSNFSAASFVNVFSVFQPPKG